MARCWLLGLPLCLLGCAAATTSEAAALDTAPGADGMMCKQTLQSAPWGMSLGPGCCSGVQVALERFERRSRTDPDDATFDAAGLAAAVAE